MTLTGDIAEQAESIVNSLTHTVYQHTDNIDPAAGIYDTDCNGFVAYVLSFAAPGLVELIAPQTRPTRPLAYEYYDYFASLPPESTGGWSRIEVLADVRRGDIMTWRFPEIVPGENTGHVLIVAETPSLDPSGEFFVVRVYDSADTAHFDDTRAPGGKPSPTGATGVGSGFINFKIDDMGRPVAFLFAPPATANYAVESITTGRARPL
jgi:hypothetical protein